MIAVTSPRTHAPRRPAAWSLSDRLERSLAVVVLFLSTGALVPLVRFESIYAATLEPVEGDPFIQQMWLAIYAVVALLLVRHHRKLWPVFSRNRALWALVALTVISAAWSLEPFLTLRRSFALVCTTGFGIYLGIRYTRREIISLLLAGLGIVAVLSVVTALALPSFGASDGVTEGWRGIFLHKNHLGRTMALGTVLWVLKTVFDRQRPAVELSFLGLSAALLLLSNSKTSLVVCAAVLIGLPVLRALRADRGIIGLVLMLGGIAAPIGGAWLAVNFATAMEAIGRDPTLTGRTEVWSLVWVWISRRPFTGYGFSGFWRGTEGPSGEIAARMDEIFVNSHQVVLDIWLELGSVGVLLFIGSSTVILARCVVLLRREPGIDGLFPIVFLLFLMVLSLGESLLLEANSLFWVVYVVVAVQVTNGATWPSPSRPAVSRRAGTVMIPGRIRTSGDR